MKFNGVIELNEDERLVIILQGAEQRQTELVEIASGESFEVATAKSVDDLDAGTLSDLPYVGNAELKGSLLLELWQWTFRTRDLDFRWFRSFSLFTALAFQGCTQFPTDSFGLSKT